MQIVSGDEQTGVAGEELPTPLVVKVLDSAGHAVPQQIVNFRVTAGGGSVFAGAGLTNADGVAQERWTLGPSPADSQRMEARAVDNTTGAALTFAVFKATAVAGPGNTLTKTSGDGPAPVDAPVTLGARLTDRVGNRLAGAVVHWAASVGSVSPDSSVTDTSGTAYAVWTLPLRLDITPTATARVGALTPVTFTVTPTLPSAVYTAVAGNNQTAPVGTALPDSLAVRVQLSDGRTVQGAPITWRVAASAQPSIFSPSTSLTDANGVAKTRWTLGAVAGGYRAWPDDYDLPLASFNATATVRFTASFSRGAYHSCALATGGNAYCWGPYNTQGELGVPGPYPAGELNWVPTTLKWAAISAGGYFTCALTVGGAAYCWGQNNYGQLGNGTLSGGATPSPVSGGLVFTAITTGDSHACGLTAGGAAYCWGLNYWGQLGTGDTVSSKIPRSVAGDLTFGSLSAGYEYTCGVTTVGGAVCWGRNQAGQLGSGLGLMAFSSVAAGYQHTCGVTTTGAAYCWGSNGGGALGNGDPRTDGIYASSTPVAVAGGLVFASLNSGQWTTCGTTTGGASYCWGRVLGTSGVLPENNQTTPQLYTDSLSFSRFSLSNYYVEGLGLSTDSLLYTLGTGWPPIPRLVPFQQP